MSSRAEVNESYFICLAEATGISGRVLSCALSAGHRSNLHIDYEGITFMVVVRAPVGTDLKAPGPPLDGEQVDLLTRIWEIEMDTLGEVDDA